MKKVLFLILLIGIIFVIYYYFIKEEPKEKNNEEQLDVNSNLVTCLYDKVNLFDAIEKSGDYLAYYDKSDSYTVDTMSNDLKVYLGIKLLMKKEDTNKYTTLTATNEYPTGYTKLPASIVQKYIFDIFGTDVKYENTSLVGEPHYSYTVFKYEPSDDSYIQSIINAGLSGSRYVSIIDSAIKKENILELNTRVAYVELTGDLKNTTVNIYEDHIKNNQLGQITHDKIYLHDSDIIEQYGDKFIKKFKYTFELNEDGNYYFKKVERM